MSRSAKKRFEPERPGILEPVDGFQHDGFGHDRRARGGEEKFQLIAVGADKGSGDLAGKRQAAAVAEGRPDKAHLRPALGADKTFARGGRFRLAKLADFRVKQGEAPVKPAGKQVGAG